MSIQPPMGGHLVIPQNGILYTNEPLIAGSAVLLNFNREQSYLYMKKRE